MIDPAVIAACFSDFRLVKGRKVYQIVCEVPMERANAALAALGGLPNPHYERWVAIAPLAEKPQGTDSGPVATSPTGAADSPPAATDGGSTAPRTSASTTPQAQARGAAEPATKPKRHWDDYSPSQQAGIACQNESFSRWVRANAPETRWDGQYVMERAGGRYGAADEVRWYCGVASRAELDTNPDAAARWRELYGRFEADTRYGGSVR